MQIVIDRKHIGRESPPFTVPIEPGRLKFFAKAIGETDPMYSDESCAREAGFASLPAPLTFAFCAEMTVANPFESVEAIGVELGSLLHAEQSFKYYGDVCAGDELTFRSRISDIYDKKGGALEFVVQDYSVTNQNGDLVVEMRRLFVVRN